MNTTNAVKTVLLLGLLSGLLLVGGQAVGGRQGLVIGHGDAEALRGLGIDLDLQLLPGVNPLLGRRLDGIDDRGDHVVSTDPLFLLHVLEDGKDFAAHRN